MNAHDLSSWPGLLVANERTSTQIVRECIDSYNWKNKRQIFRYAYIQRFIGWHQNTLILIFLSLLLAKVLRTVPSYLVFRMHGVRKIKNSFSDCANKMFEESPDWPGLDHTCLPIWDAQKRVNPCRFHIPRTKVGLNILKKEELLQPWREMLP